MERTLIRGAAVVSMDPAVGDLARGDILVEGSRIREVGPRLPAEGAEVVEAGGMIALPGLIDAHHHTWETALRGLGGDWMGEEYFRVVHAGIGPRCTPEDVYLGTLAGALAHLDGGTTGLFDWCHGNATPEHTDAALDALFESGIRALFGHGTVKPDPEPGRPPYYETPHPAGEIRRLRAGRLSDDAGRVTLAIAILGSDYATWEVTLHDFRLAREHGLLTSAHIWGRPDRKVPDGYRRLNGLGLLGPGHNLVHGYYLGGEELRLILGAGASVTSTPVPELQRNAAAPLTLRVRGLGGSPSIGADHEVYNGADMFDVLRFALRSARIFDNLRAAAGGGLPVREPVTMREALAWATTGNARAMGLEGRTGSITPGKEADLILLRRDGLGVWPVEDPVHAAVMFAGPRDVEAVMVGGRFAKREGRLLVPEAKLARLRERLMESRRRLLAGK
jgi:cytosine/adenosine deaminase-related metal-dependent hydrolase